MSHQLSAPTTSQKLRYAVLAGVLAGTVTVTSAQVALAATPPAAPNNIVVFPERDFVVLEGYEARVRQTATVIVTRRGVETSRAVGVIGTGDPSLEINHPGGVCWQGVTPDIKPGDVVTARFSGGGADSTQTLSPAVTGFRSVGADQLVVTGTRRADASTARMEQRIVNPDLDGTAVGRRDVRAPSRPGPYTSTLSFPTATTFQATYTFSGPTATQMRDVAAEGQMRVLSWQATDADDNRQGLTIYEFGEVGGPGFGGCPQGPQNSPPNAPSGVAATAGDGSVSVTWNPATSIPDGAAVTGYRVKAINPSGVATSVTTPVCSTGCSAAVPNLVNGTEYRVEVRARSAVGSSGPGSATGTVTPVSGIVAPRGPDSVLAFAGSPDPTVTARARWTAPAQPSGVVIDGWRVTAFNAATNARIKSVFDDEPAAPAAGTRERVVTFAAGQQVYFRVQAIASDDAGTLSATSAASNPVAAR